MAFNDNEIRYNSLDKKAEKEKTSKVYSTKIINKILEKKKRGIQTDIDCFFHGNIDYRDAGIIFEYTDEELNELLKCSQDCIYFVSKYCKFLNDNGWTNITLRDYQKDILKLYSEEKWDDKLQNYIIANQYIIGLASRQSAKTTTTVAYFVWSLIFHSDRQIGIVSNKAKTSREIIGKIKKVIEGLPFFLKPGVLRVAQETLTFENGSYIMSASTNPTSVTGQSINLLYLDECAHIPVNLADDFWKSVFPTLSSFRNKQIIITSTPKGKQNLFFRLYDASCKGLNSFKHYRVDWWQVPGRDEKWEKETRANFGNEEFDQEFGLQFNVDSEKLIRAKDLQFMHKIKKSFISIELDCMPKYISDHIFWHPDFHPDQLTMQDLINRKFLFVVDTAEGKQAGVKGKQDSDWNIINIFEIELLSPIKILKNKAEGQSVKIKDVIQYRQVGIYMDNDQDEEQSAEACKYLTYSLFKSGEGMIDNVRILLEMNFNGKNFLNIFEDHPMWYGALILQTYHVKPIPGQIQQKKFGFKTTRGANGKNYYCELGAKMISKRQIIISQYDNNPNKSSIGELENFEKNPKGVYEGSCTHDDIAITILFVSRVNEIDEFQQFLEEYIDHIDSSYNLEIYKKSFIVKKYLNIFVDKEELSDEDFYSFYAGNNPSNSLYQTSNNITRQII